MLDYLRPSRILRTLPRRGTYRAYLRRRRVALVGPAPSVTGTGQHDRIEAYDRVVRINHALPVPAEMRPDIGRRTDILYHNLWRGDLYAASHAELVRLLEAHVHWVCAAYPERNLDYRFADDIARFRKALGDRVPFHVVDAGHHAWARRAAATRLNAGVSAIVDLLAEPIAELYVTGFTFYGGPGPYHAHYHASGRDPLHDQEAQRRLVAAVRRRDRRLVCDPTLAEILDGVGAPPAG